MRKIFRLHHLYHTFCVRFLSFSSIEVDTIIPTVSIISVHGSNAVSSIVQLVHAQYYHILQGGAVQHLLEGGVCKLSKLWL